MTLDAATPDDEVALAQLVESSARAAGALRYGSILRVGTATAVVNPDSPFLLGNAAGAVGGTPAQATATLRALESLYVEAGREEAVVVGSPTSLPELDLVADEAGWSAVEEGVVAVAALGGLVPAAGRPCAVRPFADADLPAVAGLLADAAGLPGGAEQALLRHVGHRVEDPRALVLVAARDEQPAGVLLAVADRGLAVVTDLAVDLRARHKGLGTALVAQAVALLADRGASLLAAPAEAGGVAQRFWERAGLTEAYATTTYARRVR
ncbi:MAG: GNAT family N-acetyltransferase [Actinomycetota bacterium]|nr:GNAT family N-acetyltransferase [Actinomycetota bacterium]